MGWLGSTKLRVEILVSRDNMTESFLPEIPQIGVKYEQNREVRTRSVKRKARAHAGEESGLSRCLGKPWLHLPPAAKP